MSVVSKFYALLVSFVFCFLFQSIQAVDCSVTTSTNIMGVANVKSGVSSFKVTATFPEKMKTGTMPVSFSENIDYAFGTYNIVWLNNDTRCEITYTVKSSFGQSTYGVVAMVENLEAESGVKYTCESAPFQVDKTIPSCSSIICNPTTINPQAISQGKTELIATLSYSENMDPSVFPVISFNPSVTETLDETNITRSWTSPKVFVISYPFKTSSQQRQRDIILQAVGAQDMAGNIQGVQTTKFNIEMAQAVAGINFIATPGNGPGVIAGTTSFAIQLEYTEEMKNDLPVLTFSPGIGPTLTETGRAWETGNKIFTVNYTVISASLQKDNIQVAASGAVGLDGNPARAVTGSFWIDRVKPACTLQLSPAVVLAATENITLVIDYDETMADAAPLISFPPTSSAISLSSGTWSEGNTRYTAIFAIGQGASFATGNVSVSGAKDLAGNDQNASAIPITIDQRVPKVTSVVMTPNKLVIGTVAAELKIDFDIAMDSQVPDISFAPTLPTGLLTVQTVVWSADKKTCTINYTFNDLINFKQDEIGITVSGAKNENGNVMAESPHNQVFSVDVVRPACTGVTFDPVLVNDDVRQLKITIGYDNYMATDVNPVIDFLSATTIGGTFTLSGAVWTDSRTCVVSYAVTDQDVQALQVRAKVTGARSTSNNIQAEYTSVSAFDIDMKDIRIDNLTLNTQQLKCSDSQFMVTVQFNQVMTPVSDNIISFPNSNPEGFLLFDNIAWSNENKTATITYTVHANIAVNITQGSIRVGLVSNFLGRPFPGETFTNQFSAQSALPAIVSEVSSPSCHDDLNGYIHLDVSGGTSPYLYEWMKDGASFGSNSADQDNLGAGDYSVKVSDQATCYSLQTFGLVNPEAIDLVAEVTHQVERVDDGVVMLYTTGGTSPYGYYVNGVFEGEKTEIDNLPIGNYTFEVIDANTCKATVIAQVKDYRTPTAFTPNGDGFNDIFMEGNKVKIYDRDGTLVYQGDNGWNGDYHGRTARPATYFYVVTFADGPEKKGTIQLFKK